MVRPEVAAARVARAQAWLSDAEPLLAPSPDEFVADRGVIARPVANGLRAAAGLRNRIAHGYAMLDYRRVQEESRAGIRPVRLFLEVVASAAGL